MFDAIAILSVLLILAVVIHFALSGYRMLMQDRAQADVLAFRTRHSKSRGRRSTARHTRHERAQRILAAHRA